MRAGREQVIVSARFTKRFSGDCSQELEIKAPLPPSTAFKAFIGPKLPGLTTRKSSSSRNYILDKTVTSAAVIFLSPATCRERKKKRKKQRKRSFFFFF